jgi:hypothetical protein
MRLVRLPWPVRLIRLVRLGGLRRLPRGRSRRTPAAMLGTSALVTCVGLTGCTGNHGSTGSGGTGPAGTASGSSSSLPATATPDAPAQSTSAAASPTTTGRAFTVASDVVVPQSSTGLVVAAEAPDGTVFGATSGSDVVWVVTRAGQPGIAEHAATGVDAVAADANFLYVAAGDQVVAYSRVNGDVVRQWPLPVNTGFHVRSLTLTGSRLWADIAVDGSSVTNAPPDTLVEINPSFTGLLRHESVPFGTDVAGGPLGLYYVVDSKTIVAQFDSGATRSVPVNDPVNLQLSGPLAIQAVAVVGAQLLVRHDAGQGLDSQIVVYNAETVGGRTRQVSFEADASIVVMSSGPVEMVSDGSQCGGTGSCVYDFTLGHGKEGSGTPVPPGILLGPSPTIVAVEGTAVHVITYK